MIQIPTTLIEHMRRAERLVVFTGAGVSAESGIPTFRDPLTGYWSRFSPDRLATLDAYVDDPATVWGWYEWRRATIAAAQPNPAHRTIAAWAGRVPKLTLITQNVDDLHERAGSLEPIHLHGQVSKPRCLSCECPHACADPIRIEGEGRPLPPPRCEHCGGLVRPGVVWFGEPLPMHAWRAAAAAVESCDLIFVIGTSGAVRPASDLVGIALNYGAELVQVNPTASAYDTLAHFNLTGPAGDILPMIDEAAWQ